MSAVLTLAERHRSRIEAMRSAVPALDAALADYAKAHSGRFIRYGSSATGRLRIGSDIDLIADFPDRAAVEACRVADQLCASHGLIPDARPAGWVGREIFARAMTEGVVLP